MRFSMAALMLIVLSFIFFIFFVFGSILIEETHDALLPHSPDSDYTFLLKTIKNGFAVIGIIFFVAGILLIFVFDSLSDDPDIYERRY
jgi:hypothetical protein